MLCCQLGNYSIKRNDITHTYGVCMKVQKLTQMARVTKNTTNILLTLGKQMNIKLYGRVKLVVRCSIGGTYIKVKRFLDKKKNRNETFFLPLYIMQFCFDWQPHIKKNL